MSDTAPRSDVPSPERSKLAGLVQLVTAELKKVPLMLPDPERLLDKVYHRKCERWELDVHPKMNQSEILYARQVANLEKLLP